MQTLLSKHWHHLPANEVLELFETNLDQGLDLFEVRHRQQRFGRNELTPRKGKSPLVRFVKQFNNPLIYILLASSVITAVLKDPLDAVIIFAVVLVNAIIGFIQENNAEQAIEALAKAMVTEATVKALWSGAAHAGGGAGAWRHCIAQVGGIKCLLTCACCKGAIYKSLKLR